MTTILYTGESIIADRLVRSGATILRVESKIVFLEDNHTVAVGIGLSSSVAAVIDWMRGERHADTFPEWIEAGTAIVVEAGKQPDPVVRLYDASPFPIELDPEMPFALGVGSEFLNTALKYPDFFPLKGKELMAVALGIDTDTIHILATNESSRNPHGLTYADLMTEFRIRSKPATTGSKK